MRNIKDTNASASGPCVHREGRGPVADSGRGGDNLRNWKPIHCVPEETQFWLRPQMCEVMSRIRKAIDIIPVRPLGRKSGL